MQQVGKGECLKTHLKSRCRRGLPLCRKCLKHSLGQTPSQGSVLPARADWWRKEAQTSEPRSLGRYCKGTTPQLTLLLLQGVLETTRRTICV